MSILEQLFQITKHTDNLPIKKTNLNYGSQYKHEDNLKRQVMSLFYKSIPQNTIMFILPAYTTSKFS